MNTVKCCHCCEFSGVITFDIITLYEWACGISYALRVSCTTPANLSVLLTRFTVHCVHSDSSACLTRKIETARFETSIMFDQYSGHVNRTRFVFLASLSMESRNETVALL